MLRLSPSLSMSGANLAARDAWSQLHARRARSAVQKGDGRREAVEADAAFVGTVKHGWRAGSVFGGRPRLDLDDRLWLQAELYSPCQRLLRVHLSEIYLGQVPPRAPRPSSSTRSNSSRRRKVRGRPETSNSATLSLSHPSTIPQPHANLGPLQASQVARSASLPSRTTAARRHAVADVLPWPGTATATILSAASLQGVTPKVTPGVTPVVEGKGLTHRVTVG